MFKNVIADVFTKMYLFSSFAHKQNQLRITESTTLLRLSILQNCSYIKTPVSLNLQLI